MRLLKEERHIIASIILSFAPEAKVLLFGSRTDDTKRGGDIDLLVIGKNITSHDVRQMKISIKDALGDQKIDIVAEDPDNRSNFGKLVEFDAIPLLSNNN